MNIELGEIVIDSMTPEDIPLAAKVISYAVMSNPVTFALWGGESPSIQRRIETLTRSVNLANPHNRGLIARQSGRIVGACNWVAWPHCQMTLVESLRIFPRALMLLRGSALRALKLYSFWAKHDPRKPHWHLDAIGVLPELQGKGVGARFLDRICEMLDENRSAAYLETAIPEFVGFHKRLGFNILGEAEFLGVSNWFMWREPVSLPEL